MARTLPFCWFLRICQEKLKKEIDILRDRLQIDQLENDKKLANTVLEMDGRIEELEIIDKKHQKLNGELREEVKKETERRKFAENELALIKGIGNNSPEVRNLKAELKEVKADNKKLAEMNDK